MQGGLGSWQARECFTLRLIYSQEGRDTGVNEAKFMDLGESVDQSVGNKNTSISLIHRGQKFC